METFKQVKNAVSNTVQNVKDAVLDTAKDAEQRVSGIAQDAQEKAKAAKDRVIDLAEQALLKIKELTGSKVDILKLLEDDHKLVLNLFERLFDKECTQTMAEGLFVQLKYELDTHAAVEEAVFYPTLKNIDSILINQALAAHQQVKQLLNELAAFEKDPQEWFAKLSVLKENVEHHIGEEEGRIFALAHNRFNKDQLLILGDRLLSAKRNLHADKAGVSKKEALLQDTDKARGNQGAKKPAPHSRTKPAGKSHQGTSARRHH